MKELQYGEYKFDDNKELGPLNKADFCLYDGEGTTGEAYFFKIVKRNHKPKALKVIGCLTALDESAFETCLDEAMRQRIEECKQCGEYPMIFMREEALKNKLDTFRYKQNMPFVYKGCGAQLYYGDTWSDIKFAYTDDMHDNETTLVTLAWATALELMTRSNEIDETDYIQYLKIEGDC